MSRTPNASPGAMSDGLPRAVLVDLDGTLVDTAEDIVVAANRMLDELGAFPLPFAMVKGFIGKGVPNLVRRTLETAQLAVDPVEAQAVFERHYLAVNGRMGQVFAGVEAGLDALVRLGYRIACVTNKPEALATPLLALTGLDTWCEVLIGGDTLVHMKPHPEPLLHACRLLGVSPAHALLIGDSAVDVAAARAAGVPVAIVRYGYAGPDGPDALGGDWLIDSFEALPALLAEHRLQPAA
ncbi:phosphoglycolate phosphatase [Imbroritus primus]|uniref:phosphoglycolate phosphatase n=1 Tax=Imbroritus primus TaxID=3058603 RepID=UPI003D160538